MYSKFKFFSINGEGGFNDGFLKNVWVKGDGLTFESGKTGCFYSLSFDSGENGTIWHKIKVWAEVLEGMTYEVSYYASDIKEVMKNTGDGKRDIDQYMMDTFIEGGEKGYNLEEFWTNSPSIQSSLWDLDALFNNAVGRYLWIRIKVYGSGGENTKGLLINKIRLYYPRMSFLSYLPQVYQEDMESRDFLERFLSLFSTIHDEVEDGIDNIAKYFDPDAVEDEYLKWLSSWIGITSDDIWDKKRRELLKKAPEIYKIRGTKGAIEQMIELYTGKKPCIVEYFDYREYLKDPDKKDRLIKLFGDDPYTFSVLISSECVKENHQKMAVRKILMDEKPGYTEARLILLKNSIELDGHTYLGINSIFMENSKLLLNPEQSVLYNNELTEE